MTSYAEMVSATMRNYHMALADHVARHNPVSRLIEMARMYEDLFKEWEHASEYEWRLGERDCGFLCEFQGHSESRLGMPVRLVRGLEEIQIMPRP